MGDGDFSGMKSLGSVTSVEIGQLRSVTETGPGTVTLEETGKGAEPNRLVERTLDVRGGEARHT